MEQSQEYYAQMEKRLKNVLGKANRIVNSCSIGDYLEYLEKSLEFPFFAKSIEDHPGADIQVLELDSSDDPNDDEVDGILARGIDSDGDEVLWPLYDLEYTNKSSPIFQYLDDYSSWFVNNRS